MIKDKNNIEEETSPLLRENESPVGYFHPTGTLYKCLVLLIISVICFGSYYSYDEIENLEDDLNEAFGTGKLEFGLLYAVYSFPNIILVFFGGIIGDKFGLRLSGMLFVSFVLAGTIIVALGATVAGTWMIPKLGGYIITLIGRFIFGMGAESLNVVQSSMTTRWFKGTKSFALAMGLVLSASRLGDLLSISLATEMVDLAGFKAALWLGAVLCGVSFLAAVTYCIMDKSAEKYLHRDSSDGTQEEFNFKAVLHFDVRFWLISILCMTFYCGVIPFISISSDFLKTRFGLSPRTAGYYSSVIIFSAMVLSPLLGKISDTIGNRPLLISFGTFLILPAHLILATTTSVPPLIPIIAIGLSFSLVPSALWPSISMIVKKNEVATAFGLVSSIQNLGLTITQSIIGVLGSIDYVYVMLFMVGMDLIGGVFSILLFVIDSKGDKILKKVCSEQDDESTIN